MQKLRILVIDDEPLSATLLVEMLAVSMPCDCVATSNPKEGIERAMQDSFDFIFIDIMMPELDGITATKHLRAARINCPIIATTATGAGVSKLQRFGFNDLLSKPFTKEQAVNMVEKWKR